MDLFEVTCYPNPFGIASASGGSSCVISYTIARDSRVTLTVFSIYGEEIIKLVDCDQSAGTHMVRFTAGQRMHAGVYVYVLSTPEHTHTGKLMFVR